MKAANAFNSPPITDPMERIIADALDAAGEPYQVNALGLDFYLPCQDVYIEVKRMHSDRIADQMSRAPNVIAVQGEQAVRLLAATIAKWSVK